MSRRVFGGWGWQLSDVDFGRALATLGVLAPELGGGWVARAAARHVGPGASTRIDPDNTRAAARALDDLVRQALNKNDALQWSPRSLARLKAMTQGSLVAPSTLAEIWTGTGASNMPLQIRPLRGLDPVWTYDVLSTAAETRAPYVSIPEPPGRMRWNWPMRVGFLPLAQDLRDELYGSAGETVRNLTERETGPDRCDVLVLPVHPFTDNAWPPVSLPQASLVLLFGEARALPLDRLREIARRSAAWGAVEVTANRPGEWFRSFVRGLSHEERLVESLHEAGGIRMLVAADRLAAARPLRVAGDRLAIRMEATRAFAVEPLRLEIPREMLVRIGVRAQEAPLLADIGRGLRETDLGYARESDGASDIAVVARAVEPLLETVEANAIDRYIGAEISARIGGRYRRLAGTFDPFRAGAVHRIDVSIGPFDRHPGRIVADLPIRPEDLQAAVGHRLTIVFTEPTLLPVPLVRTVELPPIGASLPARFSLSVPDTAKRVQARIIVLHRGRILQTAILAGPTTADPTIVRQIRVPPSPPAKPITMTPSPTLRIEADLRPHMEALDDRRRFQAAIVLNHASDGTAGGTSVAGGTAQAFTFPRLAQAVRDIATTLALAEKDKAFERELDSDASLIYLRALASKGLVIYEDIGQQIEKRLAGPLEYLQILSTDPDTLLPVEACYDLPAPTGTATLCERWREAIATGRCESKSHAKNAEGLAAVVCPAGFWAISKVIERQATAGAALGETFWVGAVPTRGRSTLRRLTNVLWAASDKVDAAIPGELARLREALATATGGKSDQVETWADWADHVRIGEPPLLLLLSHTETQTADGASLEIAKSAGPEHRSLGQIGYEYVTVGPSKPGPIVLLLGCTTGTPLDAFQSFMVRFTKKGAPIVVGTIAPVLGRHASRTAQVLIEELIKLDPGSQGGDQGLAFGEALRTVRRRMLAKGMLMAMSLAAYGDADWRLAPRG